MAKKILIIETSLRAKSNSDRLAESFAEGAKAAGNAAGGVRGWVDCFENAEFMGKVFAGGVNEQGEIEGHKALDEAYSMGNAI